MIRKLRVENEKVRNWNFLLNEKWADDNKKYEDIINKLKEENEQLKIDVANISLSPNQEIIIWTKKKKNMLELN